MPVSPIFIPATPRRRRKRRSVAGPAALQVLVTSVVALPDGSARITFNLPVTLNELGPGETIHFVVEDREGYAEDLTQDGPDSILAVVPGLPIATNATWTIDPVPPCFQLPTAGVMPVPQAGTVD
jgi:hypothetical protein